jgi:hypothetical protein
VPFVFSPERIKYMRARPLQLHATVLAHSERPRVNTLRNLYREYVTHDEDGREIGRTRETVNDPGLNGEQVQVVVTVRYVDQLDMYEAKGLTLQFSKACGYRTASDLRTAWIASHPRSPLAQGVYFILGDWRDRDLFLVSTRRMRWAAGKAGGPQGDYSSTRKEGDDEVSALTPEQYRVAATHARQKDLARVAAVQRSLQDATEAERLARASAVAEEMRLNIRQELAIVADRTQRLERGRNRSD